jgi:hypothetical protein
MSDSKDDPTLLEVPPETPAKVKKPFKENRPVPPAPAETGPEVWFNCRAKNDCTGRQARLLLRISKPGGGSLLRYRCLTCKQVFSLAT